LDLGVVAYELGLDTDADADTAEGVIVIDPRLFVLRGECNWFLGFLVGDAVDGIEMGARLCSCLSCSCSCGGLFDRAVLVDDEGSFNVDSVVPIIIGFLLLYQYL